MMNDCEWEPTEEFDIAHPPVPRYSPSRLITRRRPKACIAWAGPKHVTDQTPWSFSGPWRSRIPNSH